VHSVRAVPEAVTTEEEVLRAVVVITEAAATEEEATVEVAITEEAITEAATTMEEVHTSSLAGPSGSLSTPIRTVIIPTVIPIPILTLTNILIPVTPLRMLNLRCMSNLNNRIPGITVRMRKLITRTSRVVREDGLR